MAAIFRSTIKLPITADKSLCVVREDRKPTVIFSIVDDASKAFRRRTTFEISDRDALKLATWLANIIELNGGKGPDETG